MQPSKQALDLPAAAVAPQAAPVRRGRATAYSDVGRDQLHAVVLAQTLIKRLVGWWVVTLGSTTTWVDLVLGTGH